MTQAQIVREFAADPASVALLMSGPATGVLWPESGPEQRADDDVPTVQVGPPMRSGVGFVIDLTIADPDIGAARGRLALVPGDGDRPFAGTTARLTLTAAAASAHELHRRGAMFLAALGTLAVARSSAA
jgi:hypothetical protein